MKSSADCTSEMQTSSLFTIAISLPLDLIFFIFMIVFFLLASSLLLQKIAHLIITSNLTTHEPLDSNLLCQQAPIVNLKTTLGSDHNIETHNTIIASYIP